MQAKPLPSAMHALPSPHAGSAPQVHAPTASHALALTQAPCSGPPRRVNKHREIALGASAAAHATHASVSATLQSSAVGGGGCHAQVLASGAGT